MVKNEINGYSLFNDIEDAALKLRNRVVVMANMIEQNLTKDRKVSEKGVALVMRYFAEVPEAERKDTYDAFQQRLKEEGYAKRTH